MDLNSNEIETKDEMSKTEEILVHFICYAIFVLPVFVILKIRVYDQYLPMIKAFVKNFIS